MASRPEQVGLFGQSALARRNAILLSVTRTLRRSVKAWFGGMILVILIFVALAAPLVAPYDPLEFQGEILEKPGLRFLFGTDEFGRDVFSRVVHGTRISLRVSFTAVGIALVAGSGLGMVAGHYRGWIDGVIMRIMDVLFAFPTLLLAIAIVAMLGPSLTNVMIAIGIVATPSFARLTRGSVLAVEQEPYVEAAHATGASTLRIMRYAVLPNIMAILVVQATLTLGTAIIAESSLSFLGIGNQPPSPSWGSMLTFGRGFMLHQPWVAVAPGVAIMVTVLGFNLFGDGMRDLLDPRLR